MKRRLAKGLTLVEVMIALVLGLFVGGVATSLFSSSNTAFSETARLGAINENGRYAMSVLIDEMRLVDFMGQARVTTIMNDVDLPPVTADCTSNGAGYDYTNGLWVTTAASATVENCITDAAVGSDVIFIKRSAAKPTTFANFKSDQNYVLANDVMGILFNEADTSQPSNAAVGGDVPNGNAWEYIASAYYIRDVSGEPPALYRKRLNGNVWETQEVAVGIERMHVQFGIDNNNDAVADFFVGSSGVAANEWDSVISARIFLLVRSETPNLSYVDGKTYQLGKAAFGGVSYTPNDNYYRTFFETSVMFRSRRLLIAGGF